MPSKDPVSIWKKKKSSLRGGRDCQSSWRKRLSVDGSTETLAGHFFNVIFRLSINYGDFVELS